MKNILIYFLAIGCALCASSCVDFDHHRRGHDRGYDFGQHYDRGHDSHFRSHWHH